MNCEQQTEPITQPLRALIFDLDDTLLIDEEISQAALGAVAMHVGVHDQDLFVSNVRAIAKKRWLEGPCYPFCHAIGISAMECLWGNFLGETEELRALRAWALVYRRDAFQEAVQEQPLSSLLKTKAQELSDFFAQERRDRQSLFPGARALLEKWFSCYRLGLLTNGAPDLQREKLAASGLEPFFASVIISGEHGVGKPAPAIFEIMLKQLGVTASETIMIGNSLERDIAGARAAGIRSVWVDLGVTKEKSDVQPDFIITELSQLIPLIEK